MLSRCIGERYILKCTNQVYMQLIVHVYMHFYEYFILLYTPFGKVMLLWYSFLEKMILLYTPFWKKICSFPTVFSFFLPGTPDIYIYIYIYE